MVGTISFVFSIGVWEASPQLVDKIDTSSMCFSALFKKSLGNLVFVFEHIGVGTLTLFGRVYDL